MAAKRGLLLWWKNTNNSSLKTKFSGRCLDLRQTM